jgi:hypothetical protein
MLTSNDSSVGTEDLIEQYMCIPFVLLFLKYVIYPHLRQQAWNVEITKLKAPTKLDPQAGFAGENPGFDARGVYQSFTHSVLYPFIFIYALLRFPFELIRLWYIQLSGQSITKISDANVFNLCTKTSLVLLGHFDPSDPNRYIFKMPKRSPQLLAVGKIDPTTLTIIFNGFRIERAWSKNGEVVDEGDLGRNELLLAACRYILGHWVHPTCHVGAEKCALEIQMKRIKELEPSCHFVSSLHEGLLHAALSPLSKYSPFVCGHGDSAKMVEDVSAFPFPAHILSPDKNVFEIYAFALAGRKAIQRLVRAHSLNVDPENLFLNLVMHGIDHFGCYSVLSKVPLYSIDGSGSLFSCWKAYTFTHVWLMHVDNPFNSDLLLSNLDKPFYRDLYAILSAMNQKLADEIVVSCCF